MVIPVNTPFLEFSISWSSLALLYYDYFLTFPSEIKHIWQRRFRYVTVLYFGCRYALVANVVYILAQGGKVPSSKAAHIISAVLGVLGRLSVLTIWTIRTWAVWDRNPGILMFFVPFLLAIFIIDIINVTPADLPSLDEARTILVVIFEWFSTGLTTFRCFPVIYRPRLYRTQEGILPKNSAYKKILSEGLLYLGLVSVFTLSTVVLRFKAPPGSFLQHLLNAFTLPISGTLTARFLLHMRAFKDRDIDGDDEDPLTLDSQSISKLTTKSNADIDDDFELETQTPNSGRAWRNLPGLRFSDVDDEPDTDEIVEEARIP